MVLLCIIPHSLAFLFYCTMFCYVLSGIPQYLKLKVSKALDVYSGKAAMDDNARLFIIGY